MGNHCAPCCFQKGGESDSILQENIKDGKNGYKLDNSIRGGKDALPSSKMDLSMKKGNALNVEDWGLDDETSLPFDAKYLKITLEEAFAENADEIFLGLIDQDQTLAFTVCVNNFKIQNLSLVRNCLGYLHYYVEGISVSSLSHWRGLYLERGPQRSTTQ